MIRDFFVTNRDFFMSLGMALTTINSSLREWDTTSVLFRVHMYDMLFLLLAQLAIVPFCNIIQYIDEKKD